MYVRSFHSLPAFRSCSNFHSFTLAYSSIQNVCRSRSTSIFCYFWVSLSFSVCLSFSISVTVWPSLFRSRIRKNFSPDKTWDMNVDHGAGHIIFIRKLLFFDDFDGDDKDVTVSRWMLKTGIESRIITMYALYVKVRGWNERRARYSQYHYCSTHAVCLLPLRSSLHHRCVLIDECMVWFGVK